MSGIEQVEEYPRDDAQPWVDAPELDQLKGVSWIEDDGEGGRRYYHGDYELTYEGPDGELSPMRWDESQKDWVDCAPHYRDNDAPNGVPNEDSRQQADDTDEFGSCDGGEQTDIGRDTRGFKRPDWAAGTRRARAGKRGGQPTIYSSSTGDGPVAVQSRELRRVRGEKKHRKLKMAALAGALAVGVLIQDTAVFMAGDLFQRQVDAWASTNVPGLRFLGQNSDVVQVGTIGSSGDIDIAIVSGSKATTTDTTWIQGVMPGNNIITAPNSKQTEQVTLKANVDFKIKQDAITTEETQDGHLVVWIDPTKYGGKAISSHITDPSSTASGSADELRSIFGGIGNTTVGDTNAQVNKANSEAEASLLEANNENYGVAKVIAAGVVIQMRNQFKQYEQFLRKANNQADTDQANQIAAMLKKKVYAGFRKPQLGGKYANMDTNPNKQLVGTGKPVADQVVDLPSTSLPTAPVAGMISPKRKATAEIPGTKKVIFDKPARKSKQKLIKSANFVFIPSNWSAN